MAEVYFGHGLVKKRKGIGENIESLGDALKEKAHCGPCGCDPVLGLWTQIDSTTGELMGVYIDNGVLTVADYDTALAAVKAACNAR